ncbi:CD63 antigen-like [Cylas formicarius]|uniref:CD63 antigen-like n=1 Tax=Cylas formicarius TaxID=197179 RepID=UPI002958B23B|nr:CD63 antigen-like [Cylas formicarius]
MGCATGIVKYLVFLANLVFALAGLALVIIGILFKLNITDATRVLPTDFGLAPILSIVIGAIIFITAFLGCCGAVKESPCMLTTYAIVLLTIFIIQIAIGVYAFLQIQNEHQFRYTLKQQIQKTFDEANGNHKEAREARDVVQRWLKCCGVEGPDEYYGQKPKSCCATDTIDGCPSTNNPAFPEGCSDKLYSFVVNKSQIIGGVAIGIAAAEIIGAVFGLCLSSSIRNQYRRHMYT